jgi:hypothetical protein
VSRFSLSNAIVLAIAACEQPWTPVRDPEPTPVPIPIPAPPIDAGTETLPISACHTIVMLVDRGGTWIGAPPGIRCYAPFKAGSFDRDWVETELQRLWDQLKRTKCRPTVELSVVAGTYRDWPLYSIWYTGFKREVVEPTAMAMTFDGAPRSPRCTGALDLNEHARRPKTKRPPPPHYPKIDPSLPDGKMTGKRTLEVRRDGMFLDGTRVEIAGLANALGAATEDSFTVILMADYSTDSALIHRIVHTVKSAGYDHVAYQVIL